MNNKTARAKRNADRILEAIGPEGATRDEIESAIIDQIEGEKAQASISMVLSKREAAGEIVFVEGRYMRIDQTVAPDSNDSIAARAASVGTNDVIPMSRRSGRDLKLYVAPHCYQGVTQYAASVNGIWATYPGWNDVKVYIGPSQEAPVWVDAHIIRGADLFKIYQNSSVIDKQEVLEYRIDRAKGHIIMIALAD